MLFFFKKQPSWWNWPFHTSARLDINWESEGGVEDFVCTMVQLGELLEATGTVKLEESAETWSRLWQEWPSVTKAFFQTAHRLSGSRGVS